jgi:hypothetical protein
MLRTFVAVGALLMAASHCWSQVRGVPSNSVEARARIQEQLPDNTKYIPDFKVGEVYSLEELEGKVLQVIDKKAVHVEITGPIFGVSPSGRVGVEIRCPTEGLTDDKPVRANYWSETFGHSHFKVTGTTRYKTVLGTMATIFVLEGVEVPAPPIAWNPSPAQLRRERRQEAKGKEWERRQGIQRASYLVAAKAFLKDGQLFNATQRLQLIVKESPKSVEAAEARKLMFCVLAASL